MWICSNNSYISAVEHWDDPTLVCIRGRRIEDVKNFIGEDCPITVMEKADYYARTVITKEFLKQLLAKQVDNIDYYNFKGSVEDEDLKHFYGEVWASSIRNLDPDWVQRRSAKRR